MLYIYSNGKGYARAASETIGRWGDIGMSKKPGRSKPRMQYTPIDRLKRQKGGNLQSALVGLPGATFSSWYADYLPNILWACLLSSHLERDHYLSIFRSILEAARLVDEGNRPRVLSHNMLAKAPDKVFDRIFAPTFADAKAKSALRALSLVDCLPDRSHWARSLDKAESADWNALARAVADNFDHQSQSATDVRWLKAVHEVLSGQVRFSTSQSEMLEEWRLYPNKGDMRKVRPSIRSFEMALRNIEQGNESFGASERTPMMGETFWKEMKAKTECAFPGGFEPPTRPSEELRDELIRLMETVHLHFNETLVTTAADPRHDGAFGLVLFAMSYLVSLAAFYGHDFPYSRVVLRSIVEVFITLEYLAHKDDPTLWEQYRRYGAGQAKLAFLKNVDAEDASEFVNLELLEELANEDMWMELEDIRIGNWAKTDLRSMATEAGVKDVYDCYYDVTSGFAHGHWIAVRETAFVTCMNPLHRFHRIPGPPLATLPSVLVDGAKLLNRMLDALNRLYPTFKARVTAHKAPHPSPKDRGSTDEK